MATVYRNVQMLLPGRKEQGDVFLTDDINTELGLPNEITLRDYMDWFVDYNGTDAEVMISEERNMATFVEENPEGTRMYYNYVLRTDKALYCLVLNCLIEYNDKYAPMFEEWSKTITVK